MFNWKIDIDGGHDLLGRELDSLDEVALLDAVRGLLARHGADKADAVIEVAVVACFSCAIAEHELRAKSVIEKEFGKRVSVTLSHHVGQPHFVKREHAAILNASLRPLARRVVADFKAAAQSIKCSITSNDGTMMTLAETAASPVKTLSSGPTNSMRGASALCDARSAFVIDVGGTTTEV